MNPSPAPPLPRPHPRLCPLGCAVVALLVSLFFHSPRLWALRHPMPGSTYWDRGLQFMLQVENPFGAQLTDAGLGWRLAPAWLARGLGLHGYAALLVPWLGLLLLLTLFATLVLRRLDDRWLALLGTVLLGTTSATLTVTGWLGLNDAWYASALLTLAFVRQPAALVIAAFAGPWVDERFVLALPLALWVRATVLKDGWRPRFVLPLVAAALGFYGVVRGLNLLHVPTAASGQYLRSMLDGACREWLPWVSLGWFMGLRAAWLLVVIALGGECRRADLSPGLFWPLALTLGPMLAITFLGADTGRTSTMLLPLLLLGLERLLALRGLADTRRFLGWLVAANLLMPAMQVTDRSGDIINLLPVEVFRLLGHS